MKLIVQQLRSSDSNANQQPLSYFKVSSNSYFSYVKSRVDVKV